MLSDIRAYDQAKLRLKRGQDERIPFTLVERRVAGDSPLKLWREHRNMTQGKLAKKAGVSREMIAAIEAGHKNGSVTTLKKLAATLDVDLDQLV